MLFVFVRFPSLQVIASQCMVMGFGTVNNLIDRWESKTYEVRLKGGGFRGAKCIGLDYASTERGLVMGQPLLFWPLGR